MTKPTPHLKKVSKSKLPDDMKQSWDQANHLTGDATFVEVSGNNPDVYRWYLDEFYQKLFYSDRLETTLVELIRLRLANVHGCAFSDREKSALKLADQMVLTNEKGNISSDLYSELNAHFNDGEIYELGMIMAVLVGVAKFTFVYDLVEKEDYCPF